MTLIVITSDESGIDVEEMTEAELSAKLAENHWGPVRMLDAIPECHDGHFYVPRAGDDTKMLVIRGSVVVPRPKEVVTAWEVP